MSELVVTDVTTEEWQRLVTQGLRYNEDTNTKYTFPKMSKLFGRAYMLWLCYSYAYKMETLPDVEWCGLEGDVPLSLLENRIKPIAKRLKEEHERSH